VVAIVRGNEPGFVAMLLAATLACWVYMLVHIFYGARIREPCFGFRDDRALTRFQYLIAPWFAGAGVVVGVFFAAVVSIAK
jgi:hypothetical protein